MPGRQVRGVRGGGSCGHGAGGVLTDSTWVSRLAWEPSRGPGAAAASGGVNIDLLTGTSRGAGCGGCAEPPGWAVLCESCISVLRTPQPLVPKTAKGWGRVWHQCGGGSVGTLCLAWRELGAAVAEVNPASLHPHAGQRESIRLGPCPRLAVAVPVLSAAAFRAGMDFHKELHRIEAKEGLRGRKLQKALESFAWNITVLKVSSDGCQPCPAPRPPPRACCGSAGGDTDSFGGARRWLRQRVVAVGQLVPGTGVGAARD